MTSEDVSVGLPSGLPSGQAKSNKNNGRKIKQHTQASTRAEQNYYVEAQPKPGWRISRQRLRDGRQKPYFFTKTDEKARFKDCW